MASIMMAHAEHLEIQQTEERGLDVLVFLRVNHDDPGQRTSNAACQVNEHTRLYDSMNLPDALCHSPFNKSKLSGSYLPFRPCIDSNVPCMTRMDTAISPRTSPG